MRAHLASSASSGVSKVQNSSKKIEALVPPKLRHASSEVNERNGAIQRNMAWVSCHSAVCALRRASDLGAVV